MTRPLHRRGEFVVVGAALLVALAAAGCTYGGYDEPAHAEGTGAPGVGMGAAGAGTGGATGMGMAPVTIAPPAGAALSGTIRLSPALAGKALPTDTIYVIVRSAPVGPPLAVKKIVAASYPVSFAVTEGDVMGGGAGSAAGAGPGGPFAGNLWVIVRVDRDGNAGPAAPGDLEGAFAGNPVTVGASGMDVVVDREIGAAAPSGMAAPGMAAPGMAAPGMAAPGMAVAPETPAPPPGALPVAGPPPGSSAGAGPVAGVVDVDPAQASKVLPSDTLFIIVRNAPVGPPLAVKKIVGPRFPVSFEVGPADAMAGPGTWTTGPFWVSARLDKDGDAMSKGPGDVAGKIASPVPGGAIGLRLVLAEPL